MILYLAPHQAENILLEELQFKNIPIVSQNGRLVITEDHDLPVIWGQVCGKNARKVEFTSVNHAATRLKEIQPNWALFSIENHRRAELIQQKLAYYPTKPTKFLNAQLKRPMGFWTLLDHNTLIESHNTSSSYPLGEIRFEEDRFNPPSRAYLKLWEFFTLHADYLPKANDKVIDMGSCPGGWTWVLNQLNCQITAVDRSPLDQSLSHEKNITEIKGDAFKVSPDDFEKFDWFFSDLICYPDKLFELVYKWYESGKVRNFVCTIKYQGKTDFQATEKFLEMKGSKIIHQFHNKHEVTWFLLRDDVSKKQTN